MNQTKSVKQPEKYRYHEWHCMEFSTNSGTCLHTRAIHPTEY